MRSNGEWSPSDSEPTSKVSGGIEEVISRIDQAFHRNWHKGENWRVINELLAGKNHEVRQNRAKGLAVYLEVIALRTDPFKKFKLVDIYKAVSVLPIDKPKFTSIGAFEKFVNRGNGRTRESLLEHLKDKSRGVGNTKLGIGLLSLVKRLYASDLKLNLSEITRQVNSAIARSVRNNGAETTIVEFGLPDTDKVRERLAEGSNFVSESRVKQLLSNEVRNLSRLSRYGNKDFRQHLVKPLTRTKPLHALDRVEIDSTVFSFPFRGENGKASIRLFVCLVVDCYSGKVLGYAFGGSENANLVIDAIKNSFSNLKLLPAEIFTDRFPGYNNQEINLFIEQLKKMGCKFDFERTGNPRAKGTVESTINNICELAKQYPNFLGKNITTSSPESRKSVEKIAEITRPSNLHDLKVIKGQIQDLITHYNCRTSKSSQDTRAEKFGNSAKPNAIELAFENRIWLFHKSATYKVEAGLIKIHRRHQTFIYEIKDFGIRLRYNETDVRIRYTDDDLWNGNEIYLFTVDTDEILCTSLPQKKPFIAKINQSENDRKIINEHIEDNKQFKNYVAERVEELGDIEILNYLNSTKLELIDAEEAYAMQAMNDRHEVTREYDVVDNMGEDGKKVILRGDLRAKWINESNYTSLDSSQSSDSLDRLDIGMSEQEFDLIGD